jgi:cyclopropane-fatty-acyl-phospholipid synthase
MSSDKAVQMSSAGVARDTRTARGASSVAGRLMEGFLRVMGRPAIRVELWTGDVAQVCDGEPVATVRVGDLRTLLRLLYHPELEFGEAYTEGRIEVDGDLVALMEVIYVTPIQPWAVRFLQRGAGARAHTLADSRHNIHRHYDLGNEFYRLWLDREMVYTCAYFPTPEATLEEAQLAKMEHVCRKVALRPGDRVVEQISFARERARREGVESLVEFVEDDYRNITGEYDVFMSVGMLEHVGPPHYSELGRLIGRSLSTRGRGLIHTIGRSRTMPLNAWIEKHIFPGAYPPTLGEMMPIFEPSGLCVVDVENLRLHYARTAEHWLQRYREHIDEVRRMFDERFARAWLLYLCGTVGAFRCATLELFQVAFTRVRHDAMPWTRAHLYREDGAAA